VTALAVLGAGAWARRSPPPSRQDSRSRSGRAMPRRRPRSPKPAATLATFPRSSCPRRFASRRISRNPSTAPACSVAATPVAGLRDLLGRLRGGRIPLVWLCKGFQQEGAALPHEVVAASGLRAPSGALSGPSFALEVAKGLPMRADAGLCRRGLRREYRRAAARRPPARLPLGRPGRRGNRRRGEERARHRGRHLRRPRPRAECARGADHARPRRNWRAWASRSAAAPKP
jgi:hypothetical protein